MARAAYQNLRNIQFGKAPPKQRIVTKLSMKPLVVTAMGTSPVFTPNVPKPQRPKLHLRNS